MSRAKTFAQETHCAYCDSAFDETKIGKRRTKDHIIPKLLRPPTHRYSVVAACQHCNQIKGSMTPEAMRAVAEDMRKGAALFERMARRVETLIEERGLTYE